MIALVLLLIASCGLLYLRAPGKNEAAVYRMMQEFSRGMTVEQASAIVSRHLTPDIKTKQTETGISVWTDIGLWDAIQLNIDFVDGSLMTAQIRNSDANAPLKGAPADIPEMNESSNKGLLRAGEPSAGRQSAEP